MLAIKPLIYCSGPQDRLSTFKELAVSGTSPKEGSAFHSFECQPSVAVNRIDLFDVLALHPYDIALMEACQHLIHLIFYPSLSFTRQVMVLSARPAWTKGDVAVDQKRMEMYGFPAELILMLRF